MNRVLVISDNSFLLDKFILLIKDKKLTESVTFSFAHSFNNKALLNTEIGGFTIESIRVKEAVKEITENYDLVFSLHCKQLFPAELVKQVKCINVHPGLNPYNRGWFPQVFSIINSMPLGATIHEIDEQLDHGPIIYQKEVEIKPWDTSLSAYNKVLEAELDMLNQNLENLINGTYEVFFPESEGNVNLKRDFDALCKIDLDATTTYRECINMLRALTHGEYRNAYFEGPETNKKIFLHLNLEARD